MRVLPRKEESIENIVDPILDRNSIVDWNALSKKQEKPMGKSKEYITALAYYIGAPWRVQSVVLDCVEKYTAKLELHTRGSLTKVLSDSRRRSE